MSDDTKHYGDPIAQAEIAAWKAVLRDYKPIVTKGCLRLVHNQGVTPLDKDYRQ